MTTPPGWYQDPWAQGGYLRWWDGMQWTHHVHPAPVQPVAPPQPRGAVAGQEPWWPTDWATWPAPRNLIAGESRYQDALQRICGERCESGYLIPVEVVLRREPQNQYDPNAMRAEVRGQHVGYLRRQIAAVVAPALDDHGIASVTVCGLIRGGSIGADMIGCHLWLDRPLGGPTITVEDIDEVGDGWRVGWPPYDREGVP